MRSCRVLYSQASVLAAVSSRSLLTRRSGAMVNICLPRVRNYHIAAIPNCGVVQSIQSSEINLFDTFGIPIAYNINEVKLDQAYKNLQKKLHPDKFATKSVDEQAVSTNASTAINMSFQTLKSPIQRAEYLIRILFKKNIFDDSKLNQDKGLMMEMFEWRERIQDVQDKNESKAVHKEVSDIFSQLEADFAKAIDDRNESLSLHLAIKMKYYMKMKEDLGESMH